MVLRPEVPDGVVSQVGRSKDHIVGPEDTGHGAGAVRGQAARRELTAGRDVVRDGPRRHSPLLTALDDRRIRQNLPDAYGTKKAQKHERHVNALLEEPVLRLCGLRTGHGRNPF